MSKVKDKIETNKNNNRKHVKRVGVAAKFSIFIPGIPVSILGRFAGLIYSDFLRLSS
jgi:hypothetical protein